MTDKQSEQFSGTMAVRDKHAFDTKRLEAYMAAHVEGFTGPLDVEQFKGGQSNPTYKLHAGGQSYVLRRKPPGQLLKSAHAVDREYRVITALADTDVPVPKTYCLCEDEDVIGTAFYIMDCVDGRVLWDPSLPDFDADTRAAMYDDMNRVIAALHNVDYERAGLGDYGKHGDYLARQIARWTKQYRASETHDIPSMNKLMEWLPDNIPAGDETAIVHGDYRLDNLIFHPTEPRIVAVLDWELSTLGHPLADFSYHCMAWHMPQAFRGLSGVDLAALGIPDEKTYADRYFERVGREPVSADYWDYCMAYNMFRIAAILQGIMGRVKDGTAASKQAEQMGRMAGPLGDLGWQQVEKILARQ